MAGLIHDVGHGPFSHLYDRMFMPKAVKDNQWEHEAASASLFDFLIEDNNLLPEFAKYGLDAAHIKFVKELVFGGEEDAPAGWEVIKGHFD
jgi:HD superfamily phosphohydrolase